MGLAAMLTNSILDVWNGLVIAIAQPLGQFGHDLDNVSLGLAMAALLLPMTLAVIARRLVAVVATLTLLIGTGVVVASPGAIATVVAVESYLTALFIAAAAFRSWRSDQAIRRELAAFRQELDQLHLAESRRMLLSLKSLEKVPELSPSN